MSNEADRAPCEECQHLADPVHRVTDEEGRRLERPVFRGWFCAHCGHLTKPIFRERKLEVPS